MGVLTGVDVVVTGELEQAAIDTVAKGLRAVREWSAESARLRPVSRCTMVPEPASLSVSAPSGLSSHS